MKVLVVDDNKNDRLLLFTLLKSRSYDVSEACNGIEALDKIEKETPDIIVSDIMMPEMDGFMLLQSLKENRKTKTIPFVFYSATYTTEKDIEFGLSLGASRFLIKPMELSALLLEIEGVIKELKAGEPKSAKPSLTSEEYREKYGQRILHKLESKIKALEEEIRKRKEAQDELHKLKEGLELKVKERTRELEIEIEMHKKSERVKSDFLSRMSHEFRTPLNAVLGFSEILKMKTPGELNEKQEHYVDNIYNSGKHLLGIINDMLDLLKIESGDELPLSLESFFAPEVIDETMIFVKEKAARKDIELKKEIDPVLGDIKADKLRFKQILLNLLDNAIKFSKPQGGTVTVRAAKAGVMAQFSISDTGIGINETELGKIFGLFHQVDSGINRRYGGAGSGLAITKQLVEQQGGKFLVQSIYGQGSTFTFTLPLVAKTEGNK